MESIVQLLAENWVWSVMGGIAVIWIFLATVESIFTKSSRERSRREIAAYIAEGSMTPEQGERLMRADPPEDKCC